MTNQLKQEIETHLTKDFFPCTIVDIEEYANSSLNDVSDGFWIWAQKLHYQHEDDGYHDHIYESVYDLFTEIKSERA